jgi:hypothetical protein
MKIIGGEAELKKIDMNEYITDSGRSSLRLILQKLKKKKILIPNYLCVIILKILNEYEVNYSFYNIKKNLSIDNKSIIKQSYDAIYIINYFGKKHNIANIIDEEKFVIEDNVFLPKFYNYHNYPNWIGFNSFRKISPLADGSIIKSSFPLSGNLIKKNPSTFPKIKYTAKDMKYHFLNNSQFSEKQYLNLFKLAESKLDEQTTINKISSYSLFRLFDFMSGIEKEYSVRKNNFNVLDKHLNDKAIKINTIYPSFYILSVERRNELRNYLFTKYIFCPVHWPPIKVVSSQLNDTFLSIPVDSRYNIKDMKKIASYVNKFYKV